MDNSAASFPKPSAVTEAMVAFAADALLKIAQRVAVGT